MNILVTGANGQLGNEMQLVARTSRDHYIFTDVCDGYPTLDITDLDAVRQVVAEEKIGCIINCAAWTNVDKAETAGDIVETLNAIAPENLARAMKEVGGLLVHVSTDYVFGADPYNTPCQETQTGTPTGVYGLTKLHGEEKIIATGVDHLIIARHGSIAALVTTLSRRCSSSRPRSLSSRSSSTSAAHRPMQATLLPPSSTSWSIENIRTILVSIISAMRVSPHGTTSLK